MSEQTEKPWFGVAAIAAGTGMTARQVYYLHETGQIPTFKLGNRIGLRPARWREYIEQLEKGAAA